MGRHQPSVINRAFKNLSRLSTSREKNQQSLIRSVYITVKRCEKAGIKSKDFLFRDPGFIQSQFLVLITMTAFVIIPNHVKRVNFLPVYLEFQICAVGLLGVTGNTMHMEKTAREPQLHGVLAAPYFFLPLPVEVLSFSRHFSAPKASASGIRRLSLYF